MNKTETKSTVSLKHHSKALKLSTVLAECEKIVQQITRHSTITLTMGRFTHRTLGPQRCIGITSDHRAAGVANDACDRHDGSTGRRF